MTRNVFARLFPGRDPDRHLSDPSTTRLQAALATQMQALMGSPDLQAGGIAAYLPMLRSILGGLSDEQIREGRELMRSIVEVLDDADEPAKPAPESGSTSAHRGRVNAPLAGSV